MDHDSGRSQHKSAESTGRTTRGQSMRVQDRNLEDDGEMPSILLAEAENMVTRFQSCLDKMQNMSHFSETIGEDEIGEFQLTQDIIKKSVLRLARMISQLNEKVVLFDEVLDVYHKQVSTLLDNKDLSISSNSNPRSKPAGEKARKSSHRGRAGIPLPRGGNNNDEGSEGPDDNSEGPPTNRGGNVSSRTPSSSGGAPGALGALAYMGSSSTSIIAGSSSGPSQSGRSFTAAERYVFSQANLLLYQTYESIVQQLSITVSDIRGYQKDFCLNTLEDQKLKNVWGQRFASHGHRMVPWKSFVEVITTASHQAIPASQQKALKHLLDPHDLGFVSPLSFSRFLVLFGPLSEMPSKLASHTAKEWFQGYMDRVAVEKLLYGEKKCTFLVRFKSGRTDKLVLDHVRAPGFVTTLPINITHNSVTLVDDTSNVQQTFKSLEELGDYLIKTLHWIPFCNPLRSLPYFVSTITSEASATKMLLQSYNMFEGTFLMYLSPEQSSSFLTFSYYCGEGVCKTIYLRRTAQGYQQTNTTTITSAVSPTSTANLTSTTTTQPYTTNIVTSPNEAPSFKDIHDFIQYQKQSLKFHYSSNNMPNVFFEPFRGVKNDLLSTNSSTSGSNKFVELWGPEKADTGVRLVNDAIGVCCQTLATYPKGSLGARVICDTFRVRRNGNRLTAVLCDGCSWGNMSREASQRASRTFCEYLSDEVHSSIETTENFTEHLRLALDKAHEQISFGKDNVWETGTTTLLGGCLVKLQEWDQWVFVSISVGDCKAYLWNSRTRKIKDVTSGNRASARDASDPGGRIGPYIGTGQPDLRNLAFQFTPCQPGDLLLMMTDGVYDNLDPEHLGMLPADLAANYPNILSPLAFGDRKTGIPDHWEDFPVLERNRIKQAFSLQKLEDMIVKVDGNPMEVTHDVIQNAVNTTLRSRSWMEAHPNEPEPRDFLAFPGKMDHATCITVRITDLEDGDESEDLPRRPGDWTPGKPGNSHSGSEDGPVPTTVPTSKGTRKEKEKDKEKEKEKDKKIKSKPTTKNPFSPSVSTKGKKQGDWLEAGFEALVPYSNHYNKFNTYLQKQYIHNHLQCHNAISAFEKSKDKSPKEIEAEATRILKEFFLGPTPVSVPHKDLEALKRSVEGGQFSLDMFSLIHEEIKEHLWSHWIAFKETVKKKN